MDQKEIISKSELQRKVEVYTRVGTYDQIASEIITAGGKVIFYDITQEKRLIDPSITGKKEDFQSTVRLNEDQGKLHLQQAVILADIDQAPVRFRPNDLQAVIRVKTATKMQTAISYLYGGTLKVAKLDWAFFTPLLKLWALKEKMFFVADLTENEAQIRNSLAEIPGYPEFAKKLSELVQEKTICTQERRFEEAASSRDKEKKLVEENEALLEKKEKLLFMYDDQMLQAFLTGKI